jgi:hypothetical protein
MSTETKKQLVVNEDGDVFTSSKEMESWEEWAARMVAIGESSPDASEAELQAFFQEMQINVSANHLV